MQYVNFQLIRPPVGVRWRSSHGMLASAARERAFRVVLQDYLHSLFAIDHVNKSRCCTPVDQLNYLNEINSNAPSNVIVRQGNTWSQIKCCVKLFAVAS
jgi:hypothetical protein